MGVANVDLNAYSFPSMAAPCVMKTVKLDINITTAPSLTVLNIKLNITMILMGLGMKQQPVWNGLSTIIRNLHVLHNAVEMWELVNPLLLMALRRNAKNKMKGY